MNTLDCRSIIEIKAQDADFYELSALVKLTRELLDSFRNQQGHGRLYPFEISERLTIPLQNLDDLYTMLFTENEHALSEAQRKYLNICEKLVAHCFCYIHHFIELNDSESSNNAVVDISENAQKLNYEFYYNAASELRTPASALKGYSEPRILTFMGANSSPFVPESQDKFDKISYWVEELWKFINELPNIWKAYKPEDAA